MRIAVAPLLALVAIVAYLSTTGVMDTAEDGDTSALLGGLVFGLAFIFFVVAHYFVKIKRDVCGVRVIVTVTVLLLVVISCLIHGTMPFQQ